MNPQKNDIPKITSANTKKEMLEAYHQLRRMLEERAKTELKPEKAKEERTKKEVVKAADLFTADRGVASLDQVKTEINRGLADIAAKLEEAAERYNKLNQAIRIKEKELQEIYEIEKSAHSLAALLEAQRRQKETFEREMAARREKLEEEILRTKAEWDQQKRRHNEAQKELQDKEEKRRRREKEEYEYRFKREKEQKLNQLNDEMARLQREIQEKKEAFEKEVAARQAELDQREQVVKEREKHLDELQSAVDAFPAELTKQVKKAVDEVSKRLREEAAKNEELLTKGFEGERNVLAAKIGSLEELVQNQKSQIEQLTKQLESAYGKVQDIAVKAVVSSSRQGQQPTPIQPASGETE